MTKIKILYLVSSLKKCGPINVLYGIIKNLDKHKVEICIVCLSKENEASMKDQFDLHCNKIINLNNSRLNGILKNLDTIRSIINANSIDLVHSHGLRADMINANLKGIKQFTTIHNFPHEDYVFQYGKLAGSAMASMHRRSIDRIEYPIACSAYLKDKFSERYGIKSQCVQNGIDTSKSSNDSNELRIDLRKSLGLPLDKKVFIMCGSLIKRKDPESVLKAFSEMNKDQSCLVVLGSGKLEDKLRSSYECDNIIFKGNVDNVTNYLTISDYFISASMSEGLPNAVMEAMYAGLGIVLSDIVPHREIVGSSYSYLFPLFKTTVIKEQMIRIMNNDNSELRKVNQDLIISQFNAVEMAKSYQKIYLQRCQNTES